MTNFLCQVLDNRHNKKLKGKRAEMSNELSPASSLTKSVRLANKLRDKEYRDSFVAARTKTFLARQMRKFRGNKSQTEFAAYLGTKQAVVSRMEDPNYGKQNLQTLFDIAQKLNLGLVVRFVDIPTFLRLTNDVSDNAANPTAYNDGQIDEYIQQEYAPYLPQNMVSREEA